MNSIQEKSIIYCDRSKKIRRGKIRYIMTKTANHQPIAIDIYQYYIRTPGFYVSEDLFSCGSISGQRPVLDSAGFHFTITH